MPLSEQEQRLLEEMERSLYQNDADFVATVNPRRGKPNYTVLAIGVLIAVVGVVALLGGVIIHQPIVGVLGFVVMFVGVLLAVAPPRRRGSAADAAAPPAPEVPPEVHADGVSELFDVFLPRSSDADRVDLGGGIRLIATDTGHVWSFGSDWRREGDVDVAATVSGPAGDLLLWVWNRARARDGVRREGDADIIRRFEKAHVRP